jgi:hypothetical protein
MTQPNFTQSECQQKMAAAWAALGAFLDGLSEAQQTQFRDAAGWSVKDHVAHLTTWEESVVLLFDGQPRYATLGVDEALYTSERIDEINTRIQQRWAGAELAAVRERFDRVHAQMCALLDGLSDVELNQTMELRFPGFSQGDERKLASVISGNTDYHFLEHLGWMQALVNGQS